MKAAILNAFGTSLAIGNLPDPHPGAGKVVVDVLVAPVFSYTNEVISGANALAGRRAQIGSTVAGRGQQYARCFPIVIRNGITDNTRMVLQTTADPKYSGNLTGKSPK